MNKNILKLLAVLVMCFMICGVLVACGTQGEKGEQGDKGATGATGATGAAGADGVTPHIGTNGNWWIGETDTGIQAKGENATDCGNHQFVYETWREHKDGVEGLDIGICSDCGDAIWKKTAHEHAAVVTAPTCTAKGYTTYTCACGHTYADNYVDMIAHDYDSVVTNPTCTDAGYTTHTCKNCPASYVDATVAALGHSYDNGVVTTDPTCTTEGVKTFTCQNDNSHTYTEVVAALGHAPAVEFNADNIDTTVWTYETPVYTPHPCNDEPVYWASCVRCAHVFHETGKAAGHKPGTPVKENIVDPDCTNTGSYDSVVYCTVCNEEQSRTNVTVDANGHDYGDWKLADNCIDLCHCEHEYVYIRECANCPEIDDKTEPALGHDYGAWEKDVDPTTTTPGSLVSKCSRCTDHKNTKTLNALNGTDYTLTSVAPTCEDKGSNTYTITVDGQTFTYVEEVAANGHTYTDKFEVVVLPTDTDTGSVAIYCEDCDEFVTKTLPALTDGAYTYVKGDCDTYDKYVLTITVDGQDVDVDFEIETHYNHQPRPSGVELEKVDGVYNYYYVYKCPECGEWVVESADPKV